MLCEGTFIFTITLMLENFKKKDAGKLHNKIQFSGFENIDDLS